MQEDNEVSRCDIWSLQLPRPVTHISVFFGIQLHNI